MIVKMTRYGFLLYHRDVAQFLESLRQKGLVDITLSDFTPSAELASTIAEADHLTKVAREMKSIKIDPTVDCSRTFDSPRHAAEAFVVANAKIAECRAAIVRAEEEIRAIRIWGDFDPIAVDNLRSKGLAFRYFETTPKAFDEQWAEDYALEVIEQTKNSVYFVIVERLGEPLTISIDAMELKAPGCSVAQKEVEVERLESQIAEAQSIIASASACREEIVRLSLELGETIDFDKIMNSGEDLAEGKLKVLEGWSPNEDRASIEEFARNEAVIFTADDAKIEENPPIKLKNNFFSRLYEPIGALYMLPRYNELDMTPFFAPFFMIFFGMCFGDAGYGLVFIAAIIVLWKKIPAKFKDMAWLVMFLNISAVVFGLLTGNVFGIELMKIDALVRWREFFLDPNDVFYLSIGLGGVQVLFGQILRIFNRSKKGGSFVYGLSSLGWVILFVSSLVAGFGLAGDSFAFESVAYLACLAVAGVLILFFNSPGKNPFINFGSGLYSCYEMATGVVGDLISYVRLFAIGLAGAVIAQVFNELSVGLSGDIPVVSFLIMVVILCIGHGLNVFISALGAFVHPVRLTFVEFYKNAEFGGGGRAFTPFKKKIN